MCLDTAVDAATSYATIFHVVTLADGAFAALRPAREDDLPRLERMYFRLSSQSIYYRLFVGAPHVPHWATRFAAISALTTPTSAALVAVVGTEVVGTARFDRDADGDVAGASAEVGIVVEDAWQGRGLGRHLLRRLAQAALLQDITTFTARTLAENQRALRLFKGTFAGTRVTFADGEFAIVAPLLPPSRASAPQRPPSCNRHRVTAPQHGRAPAEAAATEEGTHALHQRTQTTDA